MTLFDTGDYWRHPGLWPGADETVMTDDQAAELLWPGITTHKRLDRDGGRRAYRVGNGGDAVTSETGWWDEAPIVDVKPNKRVWARRVARFVALAVGVAVIWWPLWPVALVVAVLGPLAAVLEVVVLAVAVLVSPWLRDYLRAAPRRSVERVFRWRWPSIASHAGLIAPAHGALRSPDLLSVSFGGRWWRPESMTLVLRVLPAQEDQDKWSKIARRLAIQLGYSLATPVVVDSLRLEVRLRREVLPTMLELGVDVTVGDLFDDPHRVPLGVSSLGGLTEWELDRPTNTSVVVAGGMGGGKSSVASDALAWFRRQVELGRPGEAIVLDPKALGDYAWCEDWATVCQTDEGMWAAIGYVYSEMIRRAAILRRLKLRTWVQLPPEEMTVFGGRILFIADELVNFFLLRGGTNKEAAARAKASWVQLEMITSMGRALGINCVLMTQHAIAEHLGPFGSTMIANTNARIGIGALEPSGAKTLFKETGEAIAARTRHVIPGRMIVMALGSTDASALPMAAQAFYPSDRYVASLPPLPASPERLVRRFDRFEDEPVIEVQEVA